MDELIIIWTSTALKQRNNTFNYWNKRNKNNLYSKKLNIKIKENTKLLKEFPEMGKPTVKINVKAIILEHYSIFYKVKINKIFILAFWDTRQNPELLLQFLKQN